MTPAEIIAASRASAPLSGSVADGNDAVRIARLPTYDIKDPAFIAEAMAWCTARWSRGPNAPMQFRPIQAVALYTTHLTGGSLLPIGTGHGKSVLSLLAADAVNAKRPLLLIPPQMRLSFERGRIEYAKSFKIPPNLRVMAYSQLSVIKSSDALDRLAPDVIVADEAHNLRHTDSARTKRLVRYMRAHPDTKCIFMSGTLTSKSLRDYAHLSEWALKNGSPVPLTKFFPVLQAFSLVLDAKPVKSSCGGGAKFAAEASDSDFGRLAPLFPDWQEYDNEPQTDEDGRPAPSNRVVEARNRFRQRFVSTPGVVGTDVPSVGCNLVFAVRPIEAPAVVKEHLERLEATWCRPDGEELDDAIAKWRCGRQITQGFYYRWVWPDGKVDVDWMRTRAGYHREVRRVVGMNRPHLDSPLGVLQNVRMSLDGKTTPVSDDSALLEAYKAWQPHSVKRWGRLRHPPTEAVWISEYILDDAVAWMEEHPTGLVWYEEHEMAQRLAKRGVKVYGAGTDPEGVPHGMALSIGCHKDGKNLQDLHHENLILSFSPSGTVMQQLVSRTHRSGQVENEVVVNYYDHTDPARNAVVSAINDSRYIQDTTGDSMRLCSAEWV